MTIRLLLTSDVIDALRRNPHLRVAAAVELVRHNNTAYTTYLNGLDRDGYRALVQSIETAAKAARV